MTFETATELRRSIAAKERSSRELLDHFVERIERLNPIINAVITLDLDRARQAAVEADDLLARGGPIGPLHGLPVTIKDAIATEGIRSTGGAVELRDHVPTQDAPAVARLKSAGAIVFGKTNLPRWSGDMETFNEMFGTTNNPWDTTRGPGGSSGGAAAAVAAGFTSFELGTDIGGSVRIPSHFCGTFGLKPSFGLVPQRGYLDSIGGGTTDVDINVFGPIARSADDLDLLIGVLAGPEPERAIAWRVELPAPRQPHLRDMRVGVWLDDPACRVANEYGVVLRAMADSLSDAGVKLEEAHPPVEFGAQVGLFGALLTAAMAPSMDEPDAANAFGGQHLAWLERDRERARLRSIWAEWFENYDLLLCPVTPTAALPHVQGQFAARTMEVDGAIRSYLENVSWTGLIGVVGLPAAVAPIGRTASGLPVGVQCVAPYLRDRDAVLAARGIAEVLGGFVPPRGF